MITLLKIIINLIKNNDYFYLKLLLTTIWRNIHYTSIIQD
ncbi:hypothetical protein PROVRETT_07329 [Providencia rettgeri DSM 1131]|nr:hypothetical protein PROVRETT_07329 [Providencia rettgeri DSM 1131]